MTTTRKSPEALLYAVAGALATELPNAFDDLMKLSVILGGFLGVVLIRLLIHSMDLKSQTQTEAHELQLLKLEIESGPSETGK